jgi:ribokinase
VKVFCIGDSSVNVFLQIPCETDSVSLEAKKRLMQFRLGSKTQLTGEVVTVGGNALNVAVGLARQGIQVDFMSQIGQDHDGERVMKFFTDEEQKGKLRIKNYELRIDKVEKKKEVKTNVGYVMEFQHERFILIDTSEKNYELRITNYELNRDDWVFLSSVGLKYEKFFQEVLDLKKRIGFKLAYNPSSNELKNDVSTFVDVAKNSDVLFVNKKEMEKIISNSKIQISNVIPAKAGILNNNISDQVGNYNAKDDLNKEIQELWNFNRKIVVVTDGIRGSYVFDGARMHFESSSQEPAVEKTGAGDAFESGFLAAYLKTGDIQSAMKNGTENAASVIKFVGAVEGLQFKI